MATRKITVEVEVPEGVGEDSLERLIEDLRKGVPLGVKKGEMRRSRMYEKRTRH